METEVAEVKRMASAAHALADVADRKADMAVAGQSAHEQLCAERYQNINASLAESKATNQEIWKEIKEMRAALLAGSGQAKGAETLFRMICMLLGAAGVIYGLVK